MDGVTYLQTIEVAQWSHGWNTWCTIFLLLFITCIFIIVIAADNGFDMLNFIFIILAALSFYFCLKAYDHKEQIEPIYQYKVIIDDSVSMTDFTKKYDLIEQEGLIYLIQEKEEG